jgi:GNAT superfamily N-acetyltransferase
MEKTITIRTTIEAGDLGYVMYRHGKLYHAEYGYGVGFEAYVGAGLHEFYKNYDPKQDRAWICEHEDQIIVFLLLVHRENNTAQLRYFYLENEYRGIGLGNKLLQLFIDFAKECHYDRAYLWTTDELPTAHYLYQKFGFELMEEKPSNDFGKPVIEQKYEVVF